MSFKTLVNFRDLGDYKTKDGQQIAPKRLLRSAEICDLSANDIKVLTDTYNLTEIIDLRSEKEVTEKPDDKILKATYHNIDMFKSDEYEAPALAQIERERSTLNADQRMMLVYEHLVLSPTSQKAFREIIDLILNTKEGSVIFHCFAGKDRTGLSAALVLYLLGASKETIYEDYLRTNEQRKATNETIVATLQADGANKKTIEDTRTMLHVKKEYLDYAIKLIKQHYESIDNYVENIIGVSAEEKQQLRQMYLLD